MRGIIGFESPKEYKKIKSVKYCGRVECTFCGKGDKHMQYIVDEEGYMFFICSKCWENKVSK